MLKSGGISEEEKELYIYGLFMIISQVMFFAFSCALGLVFGCFVESVIFYISFAAENLPAVIMRQRRQGAKYPPRSRFWHALGLFGFQKFMISGQPCFVPRRCVRC